MQVSRGSSDPKRQSLSSMKWHMNKEHKGINIDSRPRESDPSPSASGDIFKLPKRSTDEICIWACRTKKQRTALFQSSIPNWIESTTVLPRSHERARKIDRCIFERMCLDLAPFNEVNKPGFLRLLALLQPNFEASIHIT